MRVGLDLGSTGAKFATSTGMVGIIPAVVGEADANGIWQWGDDYIQIEHEGRQLFVGRGAQEQVEYPIHALENNKMGRRTLEPLLKATLAWLVELSGDNTLEVVATLPFDASLSEKQELSRLLDSMSGTRINAIVAGQKTSTYATIKAHRLASEGHMGFLAHVLDDDGQRLPNCTLSRGRVLVGDVGAFHMNLLVVDQLLPLGKPISRSTALGLSKAHVAIARGTGLEPWQVDQLIRSGERDGSKAFQGLAEMINQQVRNVQARAGGLFTGYFWTGGGAVALSQWLEPVKTRIVSEDPVMDNAKGALKVATRKWATKKAV